MSASSKNQRREAARQRAEALRAETARKEKRARLIMIASTVVGLALLVVLIFVIVGQGSQSAFEDVEIKPQNVEDGEVVFGDEDAAAELVVFSDYMCPHCGTFEDVNGDDLQELIDTDNVSISYFPVAYLDGSSNGSKFSTRSTNAAYCVADGDKEMFPEFHAALFADQPEMRTPGFSNEEMAEIADGLGLNDDVQQCIIDETFEDYVTAASQFAGSEHDVSGTPTAFLNGDDLSEDLDVRWDQPGELKDAALAKANE